jgi:hypothetical protein
LTSKPKISGERSCNVIEARETVDLPKQSKQKGSLAGVIAEVGPRFSLDLYIQTYRALTKVCVNLLPVFVTRTVSWCSTCLPAISFSRISFSSSLNSGGMRMVIGCPTTSASVSENAIGTCIPTGDDGVQILRNNGILSFFCLFALSNVTKNAL